MKLFATAPQEFGQSTNPQVARYQWASSETHDESQWRLIRLAQGQWQRFPPGEVCTIKAADLLRVNHPENPPTVVLGEHGAGMTSFLRWLEASALVQESCVSLSLSFRGAIQNEQTKDPIQAITSAFITGLSKAYGESFETLSGSQTLDTALEACSDLLSEHSDNSVLAVIATDLEGIPEETGKLLFSSIRSLVEGHRLSRTKLFFLGQSERAFYTGPFSHFLPVCDVYRLPFFLGQDIGRYWSEAGGGPFAKDKKDKEEVADEVMAWTGGQPLLVNLLLGYLAEQTGDGEPVSLDAVRNAGTWLREQRPATVRKWQERLADIIQNDAVLHGRMRQYVTGTTRAAIDDMELPLFISGWIRQHAATERWGIRSRCHEIWARDVLLHSERYMEGSR